MKYVLKLNKAKYVQRKIDEFVATEMKRSKEYSQCYPNATKEELERVRLYMSSIKMFQKNSKPLVDWVGDRSHPLNKISKKTIDWIFERIDDLSGVHIWSGLLTSNDYCARPTTLMWDLLSILIVADHLQDHKSGFYGGFRWQWIRAGNIYSYVGKNHSKNMVESLCRYGKDSAYWNKIEKFIQDTE